MKKYLDKRESPEKNKTLNQINYWQNYFFKEKSAPVKNQKIQKSSKKKISKEYIPQDLFKDFDKN